MGHNLASQIQLRGESGAAGGIDMATGILGDGVWEGMLEELCLAGYVHGEVMAIGSGMGLQEVGS